MTANCQRYPKGACISVLCLLLVLATLSSLGARERKQGAWISIQKTDGSIIQGELLAVKGRILILMGASRDGAALTIDDVARIQIERKSRFLGGAGLGLLSGAAVGAGAGFMSGDDKPGWFSFTAGGKAGILGIFFGLAGSLVGGIGGAMAGIDQYIEIPPGSEALKLEVLKRLSVVSKAGSYSTESVGIMPTEIKKPEQITEPYDQQPISWAEKMPPTDAEKLFSRFHLTLETGYVLSRGAESLKNVMENWGFGSTYSGVDFFGYDFSHEYPDDGGRNFLILKKLQVEYSIKKNISIGFAYYPLARYELDGWRYVKSYADTWGDSMTGIDLTGKFQGRAYFLLASFWPIPNGFSKKSAIRFSGGVGMGDLRQTFAADSSLELKKRPLSFLLAAEYDYFLNKNISLGFDIDYKYIPLKIDDFTLSGHYNDIAWGTYYSTEVPVRVDLRFPGARVNVGGLDLGLNLGFHF